MTLEKFLKRNAQIARYLEQIAAQSDSIGWVDSATPVDASFRELLAAQERLLTSAERLLESCPASLPARSNFAEAAPHAEPATVFGHAAWTSLATPAVNIATH